jgi:hypothetical protein
MLDPVRHLQLCSHHTHPCCQSGMSDNGQWTHDAELRLIDLHSVSRRAEPLFRGPEREARRKPSEARA